MKVEVENQPESVSTLRIELPPDEVTKEWDAIANSFARFAKIPGYRPGKAPRRVIEAKFRKEIQDELTKKLVSKSYHDAIEQKQLRVVSLTNVEDVQFAEDNHQNWTKGGHFGAGAFFGPLFAGRLLAARGVLPANQSRYLRAACPEVFFGAAGGSSELT